MLSAMFFRVASGTGTLACAGLIAASAALLGGCAVGPRRVAEVSEAHVASKAPPPVRAIYEGALRSTVVGLVHNPVSSTSGGIAAIKNRTRVLMPPGVYLDVPGDETAVGAPGSAGFERDLDAQGFSKASRGTIDFLVDGKAFFNRLEQAIGEAQSSIDWRVYIFDTDDHALQIADLLKERSRQVKTRIMMDRLGSVMAAYSPPETPMPEGFSQPASIQSYLKRGSRVKVRKQSNPWLVSDHAKVLMFDRKTAFLGGMNIGREYRSEWHDLMVELRGPVVADLARDFDHRWKLAGYFGDVHLFQRPKPAGSEVSAGAGIPIRVLETRPWHYEIERAQIAATRASRRQIVVMTPYFTSDAMMVELQRAAARGVDVRVVLPGRNDSELMHLSNGETAARLAMHGVKIYRYPGLMHLKAAIYDGWVCLGSANMDTLSLRINREKNIAFSDPEAVARFRSQVVDKDLRASRRVGMRELQALRTPWVKIIGDQL
jgi:cardiolipin synthase A/B